MTVDNGDRSKQGQRLGAGVRVENPHLNRQQFPANKYFRQNLQ